MLISKLFKVLRYRRDTKPVSSSPTPKGQDTMPRNSDRASGLPQILKYEFVSHSDARLCGWDRLKRHEAGKAEKQKAGFVRKFRL